MPKSGNVSPVHLHHSGMTEKGVGPSYQWGSIFPLRQGNRQIMLSLWACRETVQKNPVRDLQLAGSEVSSFQGMEGKGRQNRKCFMVCSHLRPDRSPREAVGRDILSLPGSPRIVQDSCSLWVKSKCLYDVRRGSGLKLKEGIWNKK